MTAPPTSLVGTGGADSGPPATSHPRGSLALIAMAVEMGFRDSADGS
jgi:hypothetical protein